MRRLLLLALACLFLALPAWAMTVDINTAGQAKLETLPGIGPAKAAAILEWRSTNGPFTSPAQLDDVPGIGDATLSRLLPLVTIGGAASAATSPTQAELHPKTPEIGSRDIGLAIRPAPVVADVSATPATGASASGSYDDGRVDINTASAEVLISLPGIGASKAALIVVSREQQGPFSSCADLQRVNGIGSKTVQNLEGMCTAGSGTAAPSTGGGTLATTATPTPVGNLVDINSASTAQLDTMPGIGVSKAAAIVADRDQNGPFSSCADLQRVKGIGATTVANLEHMCAAR